MPALLDRTWRRLPDLMPRARGFLCAVAAGTALAFLISLSRSLIKPAYGLVKPFLLPLPSHALVQVLIVLVSCVLIALLTRLPGKLWRSLKLGLIPFENWVWASAVVVFWVAHESASCPNRVGQRRLSGVADRGGRPNQPRFDKGRAKALDEQKATRERAAVYDQVKASVPVDKQYVFQLLEDLFPNFATYRQKYLIKTVDSMEAERDRRIFHPRCFRQYFLLKVPSELFSRREFREFQSSIQHSSEEDAAKVFSAKFQSLTKEDFKRWHFMHLIENAFDGFNPEVARGLCRGMAQNSSLWTTDAFELMIGIACTHKTLTKTKDSGGRQDFLRLIVRESGSDLYTLTLLWRLQKIEEDAHGPFLSDLMEIRAVVKEQLRAHYLKPEAPSVFEQFGSVGSNANRIEPNQFLFSWQLLGPDAQSWGIRSKANAIPL